jgi:hypothetical protein
MNRLSGWVSLEVFIEMAVDVKIRYQIPRIFEPGIVHGKESMCFALVPHSVTIQANLNDERFLSNHQCISKI